MARKKIKNLDVVKIIKRAIDSQDFLTRQEKLSRIFPRTINNIKPINADGKTIAMDDAGASIGKAGFNVDIQNEILDYVSDYFIGYQACAILKQNAFIDRACSIPAKDAIAPDYKISYLNDADKIADNKTDNIDELKEIKRDSYEKYKINEICIKQNQNKKVFGYSIVVPIVQDADMSKPFNIDGIKPGSYKGLTVIEPYWITPELDNEAATNPASKYYYLPTYYRVQGKNLRIHRSWVIRSVNSEVPDILKPVYFFGGVPLTQQIYKRVYASEKVANEAPMLAMSKRLLVADANILNMVANPEEATATLKALTEMRDNWGIFAKNPGDQVQQIDTSLADFDALIMTQYQLVASIAGMPATKLLKTTPKGFNSTGEFEERDYKQSLIEIQENDFKPIINLHNNLYTKSRFGRVIPLQVEFNPIDTPSERERAEIGNIRAMIAASNIANGITTANEERKVLKSFEGSEYSGIEDEPDDGSLADEDDGNAANLLKELYGENNEKQAETDENLTNNADFCKKNAKNDLKDEKTNANSQTLTDDKKNN